MTKTCHVDKLAIPVCAILMCWSLFQTSESVRVLAGESGSGKQKTAAPAQAVFMVVRGREPGPVPRTDVYQDANARIEFSYQRGTQAINVVTKNIGTTKILKPETHVFSEKDHKPIKPLLAEVKDNLRNTYTVSAITPIINSKLNPGIYPEKSREFKIIFIGAPIATAKSLTVVAPPNLFGNTEQFFVHIPIKDK